MRLKGRARTGVAVAASVLAHVLVFLAVRPSPDAPSPTVAPDPVPSIDVEIVRLTPPIRPSAGPVATTTETRPTRSQAPSPLRPRFSTEAPAAPAPAPVVVSPGAGRPARDPRWGVTWDERFEGVAGTLRRSAGCDHADYLKLTRAEREACQRRFAERARAIELPPSALERARQNREIGVAARRREDAQAGRASCEQSSNMGMGCPSDFTWKTR